MEEIDPQDTAVLSDDMTEPKVEQQEIKVRSVYEGLVEVAKTHGKLYRTNGKRADMMKFDLTTHSVFVGNAFIVHHGYLRMDTLETASAKVELGFLPWLTQEEEKLDPVELFRRHYYSSPNGSEKYMSSNFPAKDIDDMSDDEIAQGEPRAEARVRLEAWILCAALNGTLERYVKSQPTWREGSWWWSPFPEGQAGTQLVIKSCWWHHEEPMPMLEPGDTPDTGWVLYRRGGREMARIRQDTDIATARAMQVAVRLAAAAKSLAAEALQLEMRSKCFDMEPTVQEVNRLVEYIATGRMRQAWPVGTGGDGKQAVK